MGQYTSHPSPLKVVRSEDLPNRNPPLHTATLSSEQDQLDLYGDWFSRWVWWKLWKLWRMCTELDMVTCSRYLKLFKIFLGNVTEFRGEISSHHHQTLMLGFSLIVRVLHQKYYFTPDWVTVPVQWQSDKVTPSQTTPLQSDYHYHTDRRLVVVVNIKL